MADLVDWLRGALDTHEQIARAASDGPWMWIAGQVIQEDGAGRVVVATDLLGRAVVEREDLAHIAANDPAHVLRTVAAHREILAEFEPTRGYDGNTVEGPVCGRCAGEDMAGGLEGDPYPCKTLRLLAAIYREHPGLRDEWLEST